MLRKTEFEAIKSAGDYDAYRASMRPVIRRERIGAALGALVVVIVVGGYLTWRETYLEHLWFGDSHQGIRTLSGGTVSIESSRDAWTETFAGINHEECGLQIQAAKSRPALQTLTVNGQVNGACAVKNTVQASYLPTPSAN